MADTIDLDLPEPVPPPEIAEEEELHQELLSEIPEARQQDILSMIASDCDTAILDRSDWEKGLNDDQEQYYGILPEKNFPWPGCPFSRDTQILTRDGWQKIDAVSVGDLVLTRRDDGGLEWAPVEAIPHVWSDVMYHFKSKSVDMLVTPEHEMVVRRPGKKMTSRIQAKSLWNKTGHRIPLTGIHTGHDTSTLFNLDAGDVAEFVGWWLAEGWFIKNASGYRGTLCIGQSQMANPAKCYHLEALFDRLGFRWHQCRSRLIYTLSIRSMPRDLVALLHEQGTSSEKTVPRLFFDCTPGVIRRLLDGLIDGDGTRRRRPKRNYDVVALHTSSQQLADDVQALALLAGRRATLRVRDRRGQIVGCPRRGITRHLSYEVVICWKQWAKVDAAKHAIIPYNDLAFCVTVKNHAVYVRRNGIAAFSGNSNFSVPLTMLGVETLKPRLVGAVMGGDPPVFVRGVGGEDAKRAEIAERFLNWQIRSQMALEEKVYESAHLFLIPGTIVAKMRWTQNRRRSKSVRKFPADTPLETIFQDIFGVAIPENLKQRRGSALDWEGDLTEGGETKPVRLKLKILEREIQVLVEKEEILYDGPEVELLPAEDFLVPFQGGADVQKLPWCTHRYWLWEHELRRKVEIGAFDREAVDELIRLRHSPSPGEESAAQQTLSTMEGVTPDAGSNVKAEQYEIREHYRRIDIDDDGAEEEVVIWASPEQPRRFLGWDYLDNVYAHGRRPFRIGRYAIIPFRFHGLSFAKVIQGIQEEINAIHNQRNDLGTIRNSMTYFYRASMALPPQGRVRPGEGVPVDSTQDILVPQWGGSEAIGQAEEALLYQYFERLTGLTDLALGRQPNRVGATRTATGVASLLSEAGLRFKTSMEAFQRFWVGIFEDILALDQQYLPPETEFRVTGKIPTAIRIRDRREIMGKYNLILSATTETMNRAILRENVAIRFQTMLNPALIGSGLVDVKLLRKTFREFLKEHGEADPDSLLPAEANQMPRTPEEELAMWVSGDEPQPTPLENLSLHINVHSRQIQDPVVVSTLGPAGIKKIQAHLAQTVQLAQAQSIAAMLQPQNGRPMASPTGKQGANAITGMAAPQGMTPTQRGGGTPPLLPGGTP